MTDMIFVFSRLSTVTFALPFPFLYFARV